MKKFSFLFSVIFGVLALGKSASAADFCKPLTITTHNGLFSTLKLTGVDAYLNGKATLLNTHQAIVEHRDDSFAMDVTVKLIKAPKLNLFHHATELNINFKQTGYSKHEGGCEVLIPTEIPTDYKVVVTNNFDMGNTIQITVK